LSVWHRARSASPAMDRWPPGPESVVMSSRWGRTDVASASSSCRKAMRHRAVSGLPLGRSRNRFATDLWLHARVDLDILTCAARAAMMPA
jgi:hypothetical protein